MEKGDLRHGPCIYRYARQPRSPQRLDGSLPWTLKELRRQWITRAELFYELLHNVRSVYIPYIFNTRVAFGINVPKQAPRTGLILAYRLRAGHGAVGRIDAR